ncbi:MAG: PilZ domain-containing protein [Desulfobacterales bacterium]
MRGRLQFDMLNGETDQSIDNRNKRKNDRFDYTAGAVIESLDSISSESACIANYSSSGLYFESNALITPGTNIYLGIFGSPYGDAAADYECHRVKIRWCKDLYNEDFKYGYGAQHVDPIGAYSRDEAQHFYDLPRYLKLMMENGRESRKYPRKPAARPLLFSSPDRCGEGTIANVSKGGLFIETTCAVEVGARINLAVPGTRFDKGLALRAEVVRSTPSGIGVKLLGILKK